MLPTLAHGHQAVQGGEGAQDLHKRKDVAQTAQAAPEMGKNTQNPRERYLGMSQPRHMRVFLPGKPRTPPTPGRSEEHWRQSWLRLPLDLEPGRGQPGGGDYTEAFDLDKRV